MGTSTVLGDELTNPEIPEVVEAEPPTPPIPPIPPIPPSEDDGVTSATDVPIVEETTIKVLDMAAPEENVEAKSEFEGVGVAPDNEASVETDETPPDRSVADAGEDAETVVT